jgi:hypothetical protein
MDTEKLNRWLSLLANVGVIAGILLLAWEVRQNQESLDQANRIAVNDGMYTSLEAFNGWRLMLAGNPELEELEYRGSLDPNSLDERERRRYTLLCSSFHWLMAAGFTTEQNILASSETTIPGSARLMKLILEQPGQRWCWNVTRPQIAAYGFTEFIEMVEADSQ